MHGLPGKPQRLVEKTQGVDTEEHCAPTKSQVAVLTAQTEKQNGPKRVSLGILKNLKEGNF